MNQDNTTAMICEQKKLLDDATCILSINFKNTMLEYKNIIENFEFRFNETYERLSKFVEPIPVSVITIVELFISELSDVFKYLKITRLPLNKLLFELNKSIESPYNRYCTKCRAKIIDMLDAKISTCIDRHIYTRIGQFNIRHTDEGVAEYIDAVGIKCAGESLIQLINDRFRHHNLNLIECCAYVHYRWSVTFAF
jgi:hypothetical protein